MCDEIPLQGGRMTQGVVRKGNFVLRPCCSNSAFVHDVLKWLDHKGVTALPKFVGLTDDGREITSFLEGSSPCNLGWFNDNQLFEAGKMIKHFHDNLYDFPGCAIGQTVCHNDLSPCNFMFKNEMPYAVFDWDAAGIGDPLNDVAYAVWLWLDIGNKTPYADHKNHSPADIGKKMKVILDAYESGKSQRNLLITKIYEQMRRVAKSFLSADHFEGSQWACECEIWLRKYQADIVPHFIM